MSRIVVLTVLVGFVGITSLKHVLESAEGGVALQARVNGVELVYDLQGSGEPLVLIHGGQGDRSAFFGMVPWFAGQFRVLTFDQRGSGESEKPDTEYSIALLADDTASLMDQVGFSSAHIFGESMGG
jgi:pimeloyl-ACP methyl ester carboxylesterase